jgi:transcriptional regulator with XRE-family HTH domain
MEGPVAEVGIGATLMAARARLGWSREALAFHSGVSWSAIAQIESGRRKDVRLSSLSMLADALDVTVDYLVRGGAAPTRPLLGHRLLRYGSDDELVRASLPFLLEGIERSEFVFVATTSANIELLRGALGTDTSRVQFADASDWYGSPRQALSAYHEVLEQRCREGAPWVRIIGEPGWAGRSSSDLKAWTRYEAVLNLALASAPATIVCPYDTRSAPRRVLVDAQRTHPTLQWVDHVETSSSYCDPEDVLLGPD